MPILVIAEHDHKEIKPVTLATLGAARKIDADIHVIVAGHQCDGIAKAAAGLQGVQKVLVAKHAEFENILAESLTAILEPIASEYTHIFASATTFGKNLLPRLAAKLDVGQVSDVIAIENASTFVRPIYAGNALATVESSDSIKLITVRGTAFEKVSPTGGNATIEKISVGSLPSYTQFIKLQENKSDRPELTAARVVISGGRGLQSGENFKLIEALADKLNAAIGASRAAVDAGYVPNDYQIGQTGKVVAPELYIAVGISGAIQHLAGMKDSKIIVAINKDEEAPIFQIADYGVVGDLFELIPQLTAAL